MQSSIDVHNHLQELGIQHEIYKLPEPAGSLELAAASVGLTTKQVARARLIRVSRKPVMVITPADRKVSNTKLAFEAGGGSVEPINPSEVARISGFFPEYLPPVGLKTPVPCYIDYFTLKEDVVYTATGESTAILKIRSYDLVRATGADTVDITG